MTKDERDSSGEEPDTDLVAQAFARARKASARPPKLGKRLSQKFRPHQEQSARPATDAAAVPGAGIDPAGVDPAAAVPGAAAERRQFHGGEIGKLEKFVLSTRAPRGTGPDGRRVERSLDIPRIGAVARAEIVRRGWNEELAAGWVGGNWAGVVGAQIAAHTVVEKVDGGVVHIRCDSSNWATRLRYMQREILHTIARKLGDNIVTELRFYGPQQHRNYEGRQWVRPQGSQDTYG